MRSSDLRRSDRSSWCCGIRSVAAGVLLLGIGSGALCACTGGVSGNVSTPTPSVAPTVTARGSPTPVGTPPQAQPQPLMLSSGTGTIRGTYTFDFERGGAGSSAGADVWWQQVDSVTRFLVPQNGALLARLGATSLEVRSAGELVSPLYDRLRIDGSNSRAQNQLTPGTVIAIRTRHGHYARMRIDSYGVDLLITWITYQ